MRLFVALPVEDEARATVAAMGDGFRGGRIVPPHQYHITLAFLGADVPQMQAEECATLLGGIEADPVAWRITGLGQFGTRKPRNLHVVVEGDGLVALQRAVCRAADGAGIALASRKFVPHITLSRLRGPLDAPDSALFAEKLGSSAGPFIADRFELISSRLTEHGPIYEPIVSYPLGPDWDYEE